MNACNLAISLFDPQLDYIKGKATNADVAQSSSPILALLGSSPVKMPLVTRHLILVEKGDANVNAAHCLKSVLRKRMEERIAEKVKDPYGRSRLIASIAIDIAVVEYKNIWDIRLCSNQISSNLEIYKNWGMVNTVILNLAGGTSAARTALYLATKRKLRNLNLARREIAVKTQEEIKEIKLGILKAKCQKDMKASMAFEYFLDDNKHPVGLLAQGVGTKDAFFAAELDRLEQVLLASRNEKVLITGPTGAGKSELAKLIMSYMQTLHDNITEKNCLHINVAAIPPSLIEPELFGHEKGAFTGAIEQHKGIFERANNGIVFLDEIGELPKHLQAKLLTILDGAPFTRVGGSEPVSTAFLLLCGTNVNLQAACRKGDFRQDLFERLRTWSVDVPPIHNRFEDIKIAFQRERGEWRRNNGKDILFDSADTKKYFYSMLKEYNWPGNFREFHATFVHLAMFAGKKGITKADIEAEFQKKETYEEESALLHSSDSGHPDSISANPFDMADVARLACALDVCRKCKTASEAGNVLFAARAEAAKKNGTLFNGAASLQRLFAQFGLKACFRHGMFSIVPH